MNDEESDIRPARNPMRVSKILKTNDLPPEIANQVREADANGDGELSIADLLSVLTKKATAESQAQDLKKQLMFAFIFAFLLSISNIATSFVAVRLSKDLVVQSNGHLASTATGQDIATKAVGISEFFWIDHPSQEEIDAYIEDKVSTESNVSIPVLVGTGCATKAQSEHILNAIIDGSQVTTAFAAENGKNEEFVSLSSNGYAILGKETCFESNDGNLMMCFLEDEDSAFLCEEKERRRKLVVVDEIDNDVEKDVCRRNLNEDNKQIGHVQRRLCLSAKTDEVGPGPAYTPPTVQGKHSRTVPAPAPIEKVKETPYQIRIRDCGRFEGMKLFWNC